MDIHEYVLEHLVRERLHDARRMMAHRTLVLAARPPRITLRARLGAALIALGERLAGTPVPLAGTPVPLRGYAAPGTIHR